MQGLYVMRYSAAIANQFRKEISSVCKSVHRKFAIISDSVEWKCNVKTCFCQSIVGRGNPEALQDRVRLKQINQHNNLYRYLILTNFIF
jgi:hypothetical protein